MDVERIEKVLDELINELNRAFDELEEYWYEGTEIHVEKLSKGYRTGYVLSSKHAAFSVSMSIERSMLAFSGFSKRLYVYYDRSFNVLVISHALYGSYEVRISPELIEDIYTDFNCHSTEEYADDWELCTCDVSLIIVLKTGLTIDVEIDLGTYYCMD